LKVSDTLNPLQRRRKLMRLLSVTASMTAVTAGRACARTDQGPAAMSAANIRAGPSGPNRRAFTTTGDAANDRFSLMAASLAKRTRDQPAHSEQQQEYRNKLLHDSSLPFRRRFGEGKFAQVYTVRPTKPNGAPH
jgi:hypothetical protein